MEAAAPLYSNLLPELLLALVGQAGDVYVAEGSLEAGKTQIRLSDDIDWVSAADRQVIIVRVGSDSMMLAYLWEWGRAQDTDSSRNSEHLCTVCREILNTLSRLGAHYADLSASLDQACAADSLYSRALANGVSGTAPPACCNCQGGVLLQTCNWFADCSFRHAAMVAEGLPALAACC